MARAIWKSEKPCCFAFLNREWTNGNWQLTVDKWQLPCGSSIACASFSFLIVNCPLSIVNWRSSLEVCMIFINFWRNHLSIFVSSCTWSMVYPARKAFEITKIRLSVGSRNALSRSEITSSLFSTKPCIPCPIMRSPFWIASSKVRPMAITSPTDFMEDPNSLSTPWNFPKSQRGILHTT